MSNHNGMSLVEVMVALTILAILSPVVHQAYTYSLKVQARRAIQEEVLLFASDYLEHSKLNLITTPTEPHPFDTIRLFRSDTLNLTRKFIDSSEEKLLQETFSILVDSIPLVTITHLVPRQKENSLW